LTYREFVVGTGLWGCRKLRVKEDVVRAMKRFLERSPSYYGLEYEKVEGKILDNRLSIADLDTYFDRNWRCREYPGMRTAGTSIRIGSKSGQPQVMKVRINIDESIGIGEIYFGRSIPPGSYEYIGKHLEPFIQRNLEFATFFYEETKPLYAVIGKDRPYSIGVPSVTHRVLKRNDISMIYWANFYSHVYVEKFGEEFLISAPGQRKEKLTDGGIYYQLSQEFLVPNEIETPSAQEIVQYFESHPKIRKVKCEILLARELLKPLKKVEKRFKEGELRKLAEDVVRNIKKKYGVDIDFTPSSLQKLDKLITVHHSPETLKSEAILVEYGSYLGEVIIRNLGGKWKIHDDPKDCVIVGVSNLDALTPMHRIMKRLLEDEETSLHSYYVTLEEIVNASISKDGKNKSHKV
jgi:hypothetical protein